MTNTELRQFYEKLYFHEVDAREKIHARLQLPVTLMLAALGALAFLLQNFDYESGPWTWARIAFSALLACGSVALAIAMTFFVKTLYNNKYYFLPDSSRTSEYKKLLEQTYRNFKDCEQLVSEALDQYLVNYYIKFAAFNTQVNDRRSAFINLCHGAIITAAVFFIAAFLIFYFGQLDRSRIESVDPSKSSRGASSYSPA